MRKNLKVFGLGLVTVLFSSCLTGCAAEENILTINVLTSEDYIYIDEETGETLNDYFERDYPLTHNGQKIRVAYETTDTNETMYNLLKTGKTHYDLMCTSDYIIQKLAAENEIDVIDLEEVPSYNAYKSNYIDNQLRTAFTMPEGSKESETYAVGYMWGTLGLLFNPEYEDFDESVDFAKAVEDAANWSMLWDKNYTHTASIKDSMRDTFAVATIQAFDEEVSKLRTQYLEEKISAEEYNLELNKIFNFVCEADLDQDKLNMVKDALVSLKANSFGLEVDSGKQDIVTGKIGINLAWSGDATNSMWEAEEEGTTLLYSVPETGANVWCDAWVMPKYEDRTDEVRTAALEYLDYLSDSANAALNMSYVGYTSFIAGDSVVDYIIDNFDLRVYDSYYYIEAETEDEEDQYIELCYEDEEGEEVQFWWPDLAVTDATYNPELYYYEENEETGEEEKVILKDEETGEVVTYNDKTYSFDTTEITPDVDLKYFFEGTLEEYDIEDCVFYSDENYYQVVDEETGETSDAVGGIFFCAYPEEEVLTRCCIMQDYGENNKKVLKLWEEFKSDKLPVAAIVILIIEAGLIIAGVLIYFLGKKVRKNLRNKRIEAAQANN